MRMQRTLAVVLTIACAPPSHEDEPIARSRPDLFDLLDDPKHARKLHVALLEGRALGSV